MPGADNQQERLDGYISGYVERPSYGGRGYIKPNGRKDRTVVYVVRRRLDLTEHVIPFFERAPLLSPKQKQFESFAAIVRSMNDGDHRTSTGFARLLDKALAMNGGGRSRAARWQLAKERLSRIPRDCTPDRASKP